MLADVIVALLPVARVAVVAAVVVAAEMTDAVVVVAVAVIVAAAVGVVVAGAGAVVVAVGGAVSKADIGVVEAFVEDVNVVVFNDASADVRYSACPTSPPGKSLRPFMTMPCAAYGSSLPVPPARPSATS